MKEYIVSTDTAYEFEMRRFEELQELIRCHECRFCQGKYCTAWGDETDADGYCYLAEGKER